MLKERKGKIDRFGVCLDRSMGYPSHMREKVGKGTGLVLRNREEWLEVGQVVPVQPHFGDHMLFILEFL